MNSSQVLVSVASNALSAMTPLIFAAMGGLFTELAGMLNIALEGLILIGAFASAIAASLTGSLAVGAAAGIAAGALASWIFGSATIRLRANVFVTGLAVNVLAPGVAAILSRRFYGTTGVLAFDFGDPWKPFAALAEGFSPILRSALGQDVFVYAALLFLPIAWLLIHRTRFGLRLKATGSNPEAVAALGFSADFYRSAAIVLSGAACGMAGASLSLALGAFVPSMSAGRGWIALVAVYLGSKNVGGVAAACLLFAAAESVSNALQGSAAVAEEFVLAIPYIVTFAALVLRSLAAKLRGSKASLL